MKPKLFIGSSKESLNIAYAIQDNLSFDAEITVWTQDLFELNHNSFEDLSKFARDVDFAIFVFKPDDTFVIRDKEHNVVRDNVIFEFGLFLGYLSINRVFYLIPQNASNIHLPSDLVGLKPGYYDNERITNLNAAVAPFCNQIRQKLNEFIVDSFMGFENESQYFKRLIIEKPNNWRVKLASELFKNTTKDLRFKIEDLNSDNNFVKSKSLTYSDYLVFLKDSFIDLQRIVNILKKILISDNSDLIRELNSDDPPWRLKYTIEKIVISIRELINWENEITSINEPEELSEFKDLLSGWSYEIVNELFRIPEILDNLSKPVSERENIRPLNLKTDISEPFRKVTKLLEEIMNN